MYPISHYFDGSHWSIVNTSILLIINVVLISCFVHAWKKLFTLGGVPKNIPWVGTEQRGNGPISRAQATLRSFFGMRELIREGYDKYSKNDQAFVLPNLIHGREIILPPSQIRWLLEQPNDVLSQHEVNRLIISADRTLLHKNITQQGNVVHGQIIHRELTKDQDLYTDDMIDEIKKSLQRTWGDSTKEWREIKIFDTMIDLITRVNQRILVGLPLSQNEDYLRSAGTFGKNVVLISYLENLMLPILRPFLMPLAMSYDYFHYWKIWKHVSPIIKERLVAFQRGQEIKDYEKGQPNDYMQWATRYAFLSKNPLERTPELLTKRLAALSFAATHSPVVIITNVLFDMMSSPMAEELQQTLREEVREVLAKSPEKEWSRASLSQMVRTDSMIRESLRLNAFSARAISKKVVTPQGVDLPSGEHVPYGVIIGITATGTHYDESIYPNANSYEPFRFCTNETKEYGRDKSSTQTKSTPMVSTSTKFLAFSHGSSACPGRFYASHLMKCLLTQIFLNYDIEPIDQRPENVWFNNLIGPPMWSTLRVRRRENK